MSFIIFFVLILLFMYILYIKDYKKIYACLSLFKGFPQALESYLTSRFEALEKLYEKVNLSISESNDFIHKLIEKTDSLEKINKEMSKKPSEIYDTLLNLRGNQIDNFKYLKEEIYTKMDKIFEKIAEIKHIEDELLNCPSFKSNLERIERGIEAITLSQNERVTLTPEVFRDGIKNVEQKITVIGGILQKLNDSSEIIQKEKMSPSPKCLVLLDTPNFDKTLNTLSLIPNYPGIREWIEVGGQSPRIIKKAYAFVHTNHIHNGYKLSIELLEKANFDICRFTGFLDVEIIDRAYDLIDNNHKDIDQVILISGDKGLAGILRYAYHRYSLKAEVLFINGNTLSNDIPLMANGNVTYLDKLDFTSSKGPLLMPKRQFERKVV